MNQPMNQIEEESEEVSLPYQSMEAREVNTMRPVQTFNQSKEEADKQETNKKPERDTKQY